MKVELMLVGMKGDLNHMLKAMAADFLSPVGAIPIERLLRVHFPAFGNFRSRGLTWEQIARLLAGAGVRRADGSAFAASHLRGVFGRQRRQLEGLATGELKVGSAAEKRAPRVRTKRPQHVSGAGGDIASHGTYDPKGPHSKGIVPGSEMTGPDDTPVCLERRAALDRPERRDREPSDNAATAAQVAKAPVDRAQLLALMRQSAAARRS